MEGTDTPVATNAAATDTVGTPSGDGNTLAVSNADTTSAAPSTNPNAPTHPVTLPTTACAGSAFQICDDFENPEPSGSPNATYWQVQLTNSSCSATVESKLQSGLVYDGNYALHVHTNNPSGGAGATLHTTLPFPAANNTFYSRAYVYFDSALPTTDSTLIETGGTIGGQNDSWRLAAAGGDMLMVNNAPSGEFVQGDNGKLLPTKQWVCMEWEFKGDTNEAHFWINGAEETHLEIAPTLQNPEWTAPTWDHVYFGWEFYSQDNDAGLTEVDIYFDDVVFDSNRIGCTAATLH